MKFVYALISAPNDFYVEQAYLSVISLRRHNPEASVCILSDNETADFLQTSNHQLLNYVNELKRIEMPNLLSQVQRSRYIKTSMRRHIEGDFLYLDSDTVICREIPEIKDIANIGAVNEWHQRNKISPQRINYLQVTNKENWDNNRYFNGGVLYVKDTEKCHRFFELWHSLWYEDLVKFKIHKDQPTLSLSNSIMDNIIEELDDSFNCQLWSLDSMPFLFAAHIIHYQIDVVRQKGVNFPFQDFKLLQHVREQGITPQINQIIEFPQKAFMDNSKLLMGKEYRIYQSPMVTFAIKLSRDFDWTNKFIRFIYRLFGYRI